MGVMMLAAGVGTHDHACAPTAPTKRPRSAAMVDLFERKFDEGA